ncbi:MAG: aminopeptidase P family protein [Deltaproteobacteria bacterium]|nr:aminopeptidase P family protein [Deltaproteobacteria bacterium]
MTHDQQTVCRRRLRQLQTQLEPAGVDAFLLHTGPSLRYYCGFTGDSSYLVVRPGEAVFCTDGRYTTQAAGELPPEIEIRLLTPGNGLARQLAAFAPRRLGVEEQSLPVARSRQLQQEISGLEIVFCQQRITAPRQRKDAGELQEIRRAVAVAEEAYRAARPLLRPGISEREIALELEYQMKRRGAERTAFDLIVASGYRAALPHGLAADKPLAPGDPVTIDFGACCRGYHSDQTCTLFLGEPDREQRQVYEVLFQAQQTGMAAAQTGMAAKELDRTVREVINQAGYGEFFSHGTGHGVGLEIHEAPSISAASDQQLAAGMVFTVEPGCYFPHRWGIRLEDMVVLEEDGARRLTTLDKRLDQAIVD